MQPVPQHQPGLHQPGQQRRASGPAPVLLGIGVLAALGLGAGVVLLGQPHPPALAPVVDPATTVRRSPGTVTTPAIAAATGATAAQALTPVNSPEKAVAASITPYSKVEQEREAAWAAYRKAEAARQERERQERERQAAIAAQQAAQQAAAQQAAEAEAARQAAIKEQQAAAARAATQAAQSSPPLVPAEPQTTAAPENTQPDTPQPVTEQPDSAQPGPAQPESAPAATVTSPETASPGTVPPAVVRPDSGPAQNHTVDQGAAGTRPPTTGQAAPAAIPATPDHNTGSSDTGSSESENTSPAAPDQNTSQPTPP